jgi:hypothetical protein
MSINKYIYKPAKLIWNTLAKPLDILEDPLDIQATSLDIQAKLLDIQAKPLDIQATTLDIQAESLDVLDELLEIESKNKKKERIPHAFKIEVWNFHIGKEKGIALCYCCEKEIDSKHFECGHIISEKNGGVLSIDNLRPICDLCNKSMGSMNMDEFKAMLARLKRYKWYETDVYMGLKIPIKKDNIKWYEKDIDIKDIDIKA